MSCEATEPETTDPEFTTERAYGVEPGLVWDAIASPEQMSQWLGADVELDGPLEAGVEGTVTDDDGTRRVLIVDEVVEGERLVYRWASNADAPTEVSFDVIPDVSGTRLVIVERQLSPVSGIRGGQAKMMAGAR